MKCFLERIFQRKGKKFIILTINSAYFTDKSNNKSFSLMQLLECICFLTDNSYVVFNNKVYQQVIGILMGTNCAPYLVNILHMYKIEFIEKLNAECKHRVSVLLNNIFSLNRVFLLAK